MKKVHLKVTYSALCHADGESGSLPSTHFWALQQTVYLYFPKQLRELGTMKK